MEGGEVGWLWNRLGLGALALFLRRLLWVGTHKSRGARFFHRINLAGEPQANHLTLLVRQLAWWVPVLLLRLIVKHWKAFTLTTHH